MRLIARIAALLSLAWIFPARCPAQDHPIYLDPNADIEARINDLLPRMTLEEKIALVHANSKFSTAAIPRLKIPVRWLSDGPMGVREDISANSWKPAGHTNDFSTALPATLGLAASWDPQLAQDYGAVIGQEARKRGKSIMLGPAVNIQRSPLCGRNFEYMGEDPYLTSQIAVGYITGEQAQGVASCVKHFAANNQETNRQSINAIVDERALREIYLPAFKAAVTQAHVWCVMGAYNKVNGDFCCQNEFLLQKVLKGEWGFKGLVMSDWEAAQETRGCYLHGLDLEMGTAKKDFNDYYFANPLLDAIKSGQLPSEPLDDMVCRNLRVMFATHLFDPPPSPNSPLAGSINTPEHHAVARRVAEQDIVLLKNQNNILPLDASKIKTLAVIGENADTKLCHGGGSSELKAEYEITALKGITDLIGKDIKIVYAKGYAKKGNRAQLLAQAVNAAKSADAVIYVGGLTHDDGQDAEGSDRKDLSLPFGQAELIDAIAAANPHTVVVLYSGGAVDMDPWLDKVPALLEAWYPGMEGGHALADILFGNVNPSGKLPCTFPKRLEDSPAHAMHNFPGTGKNGTVHYAEGILVGYRWFDTKNIEPLFPFGYGLSYTTFDYSNLTLSPGKFPHKVTVHVDITNKGTRDGAEVVQLYIHPQQSKLPRPDKELKGFAKIFLKAGETKTVSFDLDDYAFAYYVPDPAFPHWIAEHGNYTIEVGSSSRDIRLQSDFTINIPVVIRYSND